MRTSALLAAIAILAGAAAAPAQDVKQKPVKDGAPETVKEKFNDRLVIKGAKAPLAGVEITSESYEKVEWKAKSGPPGSKPAAEVESIVYGDTPTNFTKGMDAWRAARWAEAAQEFKGVADAVRNVVCRKFWEARGLAYQGDSLRRQAAKEKNPAAWRRRLSPW